MPTPIPPQPDLQSQTTEKRKLELERLNEEMDKALGLKPGSKATPWSGTEKNLSKETKKALDALELKEQKPTSYKESPEMKARQDAFDRALKHRPDPGTGTWKAAPDDPVSVLESWHRAVGTPKHIAEAEIQDLKKRLQEAKK